MSKRSIQKFKKITCMTLKILEDLFSRSCEMLIEDERLLNHIRRVFENM